MKNFSATKYSLQNVTTGRIFEDEGWLLDDPEGGSPSLIRARYTTRQIEPGGDEMGIYRFAQWLPVGRMLKGSCAPVTYKSSKLAAALGLKNLYITFNGYYPKIGAHMSTCSFKETEAYSVCGRLGEDHAHKVLVVDALWFDAPLNDCVKLIAARKGGDYFDAIHLSNLVLKSDKFLAEGGAKNIARRDGMATTVLSATTFIGRIPDYYFQAIGSGTGAIAAWEANQRLIEDGRFGTHKMKLMVSQNLPFVPMYNAWRARSRAMLPYDDDQARIDAESIDAKVLSNRKPPYPIGGGLFDALIDTGGDILVATNEEARAAKKLFEETEGVDIYSAPGIALATLIKAVKSGEVDPEKIIMLNITGGGEKHFQQGKELHYLKPSLVFDLDPDPDEVVRKVSALF